PKNAEGFRASEQNETSITLQWNKGDNNTSFVLQFNGTETNISSPAGNGPVKHTVTSLTARSNYTFTLFCVFENVRSSGVSIFAATDYVLGWSLRLKLLRAMRESEMEDVLIEFLLMDFRLILFGLTGALLSVACAQSHQYYFVNTSLTWTDAQSVCRRDYTDLATIESTADVDYFLSTSSNNTGKAWIGLYDDTINSWKWSLNDSSFYGPGEYSFRNWAPGQPDDYYGQQHCVRFYGASLLPVGQWDDFFCTATMQFVCYNGTVGGSPSYVLSNISLTWTEAQNFCRANYVDLASVRNQAENEIIKNLIGFSTVWIGLYREKLWSDGSTSLFRDWAAGEPNDASGDQCVAGSFSDSGRWSDESCSLSLPFVCYRP
ncbi:hypothetical protein CCH79_00011603, partial [Gambusia affinis]